MHVFEVTYRYLSKTDYSFRPLKLPSQDGQLQWPSSQRNQMGVWTRAKGALVWIPTVSNFCIISLLSGVSLDDAFPFSLNNLSVGTAGISQWKSVLKAMFISPYEIHCPRKIKSAQVPRNELLKYNPGDLTGAVLGLGPHSGHLFGVSTQSSGWAKGRKQLAGQALLGFESHL